WDAWLMPKDAEFRARAFIAIEAAAKGGDPQLTGVVFANTADIVVAQTARYTRIMDEASPLSGGPLQLAEAAARSYPERLLPIFINRRNALRILRKRGVRGQVRQRD